jgi:hypothetical protein
MRRCELLSIATGTKTPAAVNYFIGELESFGLL